MHENLRWHEIRRNVTKIIIKILIGYITKFQIKIKYSHNYFYE